MTITSTGDFYSRSSLESRALNSSWQPWGVSEVAGLPGNKNKAATTDTTLRVWRKASL